VTRFAELLKVLSEAGVEFIIVGGVAAAAHGSGRTTQDIDVVYRRTQENIRRLVSGLASHSPYLRGAPPGLPFHLDSSTLEAGLNFTLTTTLGWLDLLGEIPGGGGYEELVGHSIVVTVFGVDCKVLDLDALIRSKRAAGRPKDFEAIAELEILREHR
jgi:predicted nucleotidyltransferase